MIGDYLQAWRKNYELIEIVISLFVSSYYIEAHSHVNLLMHLQALEVLQRTLFDTDRLGIFPDKKTKKSTLEALRSAIPLDLPPLLSMKIFESIGLIGQITLVDRLKYLYDLFPKSINPIFPSCDEDMKLLKDA